MSVLFGRVKNAFFFQRHYLTEMLFQNQNIKFDNNLLAGKMILSHFPGKMILSHFYSIFFLYQFLFDLLNQLEIDTKRKLPFQANMFFAPIRNWPLICANMLLLKSI